MSSVPESMGSLFRSSSTALQAGFQRAGVFAGTLGSLAGNALMKAGDAVEKGAKIVLEHAETAVSGSRYNNFEHAVRRMEETALSFGEEEGEDRQEAMERWLSALEQIQSKSQGAAEDITEVSTTGEPGVDGKQDSSNPAEAAALDSEKKTTPEVSEEDKSSGADASEQGASDAAKEDGKQETDESAAAPDEAKTETTVRKSGSGSGQRSIDAEVVFFDGDPRTSEPLTFRDVFLESKALEHIVTSMIAEPGNTAEWDILTKLFSLCLSEGKDGIEKLVAEIRRLSSVFSNYLEAKMSGDDLLSMVADTVSSLKINPELERLRKKSEAAMEKLKAQAGPLLEAPAAAATTAESGEGDQKAAQENGSPLNKTESAMDPEKTKSLLALGSQWLDLQRKQQAIMQRGDTPGDRLLKIQRVTSSAKELSENASSASESIAECRKQREEALTYRTKRAEENRSAEKVALAAMEALQKKKSELQKQMDEVLASMEVVGKQLQKLTEEKELFYKASSETVAAFASQGLEREQQSTVCKGDAEVLKEWQAFLELSWPMEQACMEKKQGKLKQESGAALPSIWPLAKAQLKACRAVVLQKEDTLKRQIASLETTATIKKAFDEEVKDGKRKENGTDALAVLKKVSDQEEEYLLIEYQSKAAAGEACQMLSEIQSWLSWGHHCSTTAKDKQQMAEVKQQADDLRAALSSLQAIARPPLSRDDPSVTRVPVFARPFDGKSWRIDSIGSALQSGIVVAPIGTSAKDTSATAAQRPLPPHLRPTEGDSPDQLPTPPVISGKRRDHWAS